MVRYERNVMANDHGHGNDVVGILAQKYLSSSRSTDGGLEAEKPTSLVNQQVVIRQRRLPTGSTCCHHSSQLVFCNRLCQHHPVHRILCCPMSS